ncbi:MAG: histidine--tRNA ligase [Acidobacteriota bacterium]
MKYQAVKGTRDILPEQVGVWQQAERMAHEIFSLYGFREIRTPLLEPTELFTSGLGTDTDVVTKEMYTFLDRKGRSLTLRPENTAPVVRAYLEHSRHRLGSLDRLYYLGPMFRYERPQKGRYRQFHQIGVEVFGGGEPEVDAETMQMVLVYLQRLGIGNCTLWVNSVGDENCRPRYREELLRVLADRVADLCAECRQRYQRNPLRILDCKDSACRKLIGEIPTLVEYLCDDCGAHFEGLKKNLTSLGVPFQVNPRIVRGLDYYTRTTFEIVAEGLGAQDALMGGGRYDRLVERFGGPAVPGFGFAIGLDRLVLLLSELPGETIKPPPGLYLAATGKGGAEWTLQASLELRRRNLRVETDFRARSLKAQMRNADRSACTHVLIRLEDEKAEVRLRRLRDGNQITLPEDGWDEMVREVSLGNRD